MSETPPTPKPQPSDASRARRYLFVGLLITVASVVYLVTVEGSTFIWLALAVGVVDLGIAAYLWNKSKNGPPQQQ